MSTPVVVGIVVAVAVVAAVVFGVVGMGRRRREQEVRREQAAQVRAQAEQRFPEVLDRADRASVASAIAAQARVEADENAVQASTLEEVAAEHQISADTVRQEYDTLGREADRIDPDVDSENEPDLADAADPFGTASRPASLAAVETEPDKSADDEALAGTESHVDDGTRDTGSDGNEAVGPTDEGDEMTDSIREPQDSREAEVRDEEQLAGRDPDREAPTRPEDETTVVVPALDEAKEMLVGGGTPTNDPGDHRGQPWSTSPGEPPTDSESGLDDRSESELVGEDDLDAAPVDGPEEPDRGDSADAADRTDSDDESAASPGVAEPAAAPDADRDPASGVESADADADTSADLGTDTAGDADDSTDRSDGAPAAGRRESTFEEVVDGGYGIGSAAPIHDGARPLGHTVKANRDGNVFYAPDDPGYDEAEPDVWFYNEEAARRAEFRRSGE